MLPLSPPIIEISLPECTSYKPTLPLWKSQRNYNKQPNAKATDNKKGYIFFSFFIYATLSFSFSQFYFYTNRKNWETIIKRYIASCMDFTKESIFR